jgi:nicotinamide mononucleotide transporter
MDWFLRLFSVDNTFFEIFSYKLSYLEFIGTLLNLASVWLAARNNILTWPIGNVAVVLFGILFYQIQLYSDIVEQGYFLVTGFYGWWLWHRLGKNPETEKTGAISRTTSRANVVVLLILVMGTALMGYFMSHIHEYFPNAFPEPASFAYLDAFTTVMSFAANFLLAQRKFEAWFLWIAVDVIGIGLYFAKDVILISILYAVFLGLAIRGWWRWRKALAA